MAATMAVISSTSETLAKRSWADIVKGRAVGEPSEEVRKTLTPGVRGDRTCYCLGEVLVMLSHYGWIAASDEIDHPDLAKTGGRIYVHKRDVVDKVKLQQGDVVGFYLYADDQGLGAEGCQIEKHGGDNRTDVHGLAPNVFEWSHSAALTSNQTGFAFSPSAQEFVPGNISSTQQCDVSFAWYPNAAAVEFCPTQRSVEQYDACKSWHASTNAMDFTPVEPTFNAAAKEFIPTQGRESVDTTNILSINPAFLSDCETDDDDSVDSNTSREDDGDVSCNGEDEESAVADSDQASQQDEECDDVDLVVLQAPLKRNPKSGDESTSAGESSDSESESMRVTVLHAPPGLSLPKGFRPPPGLELE